MRFTEQWSGRVAALKPLFIEAGGAGVRRRGRQRRGRADRNCSPSAGKAFAEARSANGAQALAWQRVSRSDWVDRRRVVPGGAQPGRSRPRRTPRRPRGSSSRCAICIATTKPRRSPTTAPQHDDSAARPLSRDRRRPADPQAAGAAGRGGDAPLRRRRRRRRNPPTARRRSAGTPSTRANIPPPRPGSRTRFRSSRPKTPRSASR